MEVQATLTVLPIPLYFTAGIGDESQGLFGMMNVFKGCDGN